METSRIARRHDLDWLRIGALGLLILTHTLYAYRSAPWRVQSEHAGLWGDLLIDVMAPWRISIVFFIAGAATRFMLDRHDFKNFVKNRVMRLIVPFLMAVILLVPPMHYIAEPDLRGDNYLEFLLGPGLHNYELLSVWVPEFSHVWFLPYVFLYGVVASLFWRFGRNTYETIERAITSAPVWAVVAALAACFTISDAVVGSVYPRTNMLLDDAAGHIRSIPAFALGLFLARPSVFWTRLRQVRVWLAALAATVFVLALPLAIDLSREGGNLSLGLRQLIGVVSGVYGALMLFLILSLANSLLARPGPGLSYFGDAIMPIYLMHQPVIVFVAVTLRGAGLPLWAEFGLIFSLAFGFPLFCYHFVVRPTPFLRVLFGLKPRLGAGKSAPVSAPDPLAGLQNGGLPTAKL